MTRVLGEAATSTSYRLPLANTTATAATYSPPAPLPARVSQKQITAEIIATKLLVFCREHGEWVTNLRLQRLLFYTQSWYLALNNKPLFADEFEAWAMGPVVPAVYHNYARYGGRPIEIDTQAINTPAGVDRHIESVMESYGSLSAYDLERLIKSEPPWRDARGHLDIEQITGPIIKQDAMARYYKASIANGKAEK